MPSIELNNYNNSYAPESIFVAKVDYYNYTEGETIQDSNGNTWTVHIHTNATSRKCVELNIVNVQYGLEDFFSICESLHLGNYSKYLQSDIVAAGYDASFGKGTDSWEQPYMTLISEDTQGRHIKFTVLNNTSDLIIGEFNDGKPYCASFCYFVNQLDEIRYGYVAFGRTGPSSRNSRIFIDLEKLITEDWASPDADPGDVGFKPTGAYTKPERPGNGGRGTTNKKNPDYASDTVTQPNAPNETVASVVRSGFVNIYKMSESELNKICGALYSDTLLNAVKSMFVNPLDFIISLMIFPCTPTVASTAQNIRFGKWEAALTGATSLGVQITGHKLSLGFGVVDFGTVNVPENWGNFLDYSQTTIELYLPFIGSVNLDVSECMGGSVNVKYTIDYFTGMCVANVLCTKTVTLPSGKLLSSRPAQHAFQGNCAIQVPLSATSYGSMVGSLINACTQGITNPVGGFMGMAQDAVAGGLRPNVTSKGNIVANAGFCSVLYPYLRITRPITAEPESYQEVMGLPSYINNTLGQCQGLCVCDGINLQGVSGATDNELNRIRQLCLEGVYV